MMFVSFGHLRLTFDILIAGILLVVITGSHAGSAQAHDTINSRGERGFLTDSVHVIRRTIILWRIHRARRILLADSFPYSLGDGIHVDAKRGGMKRAELDFSRLVKKRNDEDFYRFGGDKLKKGKVGFASVFFYPRYSDKVPFPVIRIGGVYKEENMIMLVYRD